MITRLLKTATVNERINLGRTSKVQLDIIRFVFAPIFREHRRPLTVLAMLDYGLTLDAALIHADGLELGYMSDEQCFNELINY
jgi:hypothetical protein